MGHDIEHNRCRSIVASIDIHRYGLPSTPSMNPGASASIAQPRHRPSSATPATRSSSSVPDPSVSPPPPTPSRARLPHRRPRGRARGRLGGPRVGSRAALLALVASWSTRSPRSCSPTRAGRARRRRPTRRAHEWVERYLTPLADALGRHPAVEVRFGSRVVGVATQGRDRLVDSGRDEAPFTVHVHGRPAASRLDRRAPSIDASGTWGDPTRSAATATPPLGEDEHADQHLLRHPRPHRSRGRERGTPASTSPSPAAAPPPRTPSSPSPASPATHPAPGSLAGAPRRAPTTPSAAATTTSSRRAARWASAPQAAADRAGHDRHRVPHRSRSTARDGPR